MVAAASRSKGAMLIALLAFLFSLSCDTTSGLNNDKALLDTTATDARVYHQFVLDKLQQQPADYVMVMAHRGDWKNAPENSLQGIQNCIALGVDFVEVDVQKTKDGEIVLMHDATLERMTNGKGSIKDKTLAELKELYLRDAGGRVTTQKIPTLREAMLEAKGRIMVFIDKSYSYLNEIHEIHEILKETGTLQQATVEGVVDLQTYQKDNPQVWATLNFVPRAGTSQTPEYISQHLGNNNNRFFFPGCNLMLLQDERAKLLSSSDKWLMISTLSSGECSEGKPTTWEWVIAQGIDIIITDQPKELIAYLKNKKLHQ